METALAAIVIGSVTLMFNIGWRIFYGGRGVGGVEARLNSIETTLSSLQAEIKKLSDVLIRMADMRGDIKLLADRVSRSEGDIREIRHGEGFVFPLMRPKPP